LAYLKDSGRATFVAVTDRAALDGFQLLSRLEGVIPALETAHAVSWIASQRGRWNRSDAILLCVSGRGDKDVAQVSDMNILDS
jgi:tryptophan synthase beta chain